MRLLFLFLFVFLQLVSGLKAQDASSIMEYIDSYKDLAIAEMKRTGVPASVKLAQGIHETAAGTSPLVIKSNNHFGIKCKTGWSGPSVKHDDDARNECFRKYDSSADSYRDHSNFLKGSARYAPLFKLDPADYEGWAWGLKKAGYATNPKYAQTIIKLIEEYGLQQYTLIAMGQKPAVTEVTEEAAPEVENSEEVIAQPVQSIKAKTTEEPVKTTVIVETTQPVKKTVTQERYPSGIFKQNGRKAVFVNAGTPYLAIAQQSNVPLAKIFEYNELSPMVEASVDQLIYLEKKPRSYTGLLSSAKKSR
jgi:Mannosyl-glycoprotein endo-beta-N-acetylglucosaminidase